MPNANRILNVVAILVIGSATFLNSAPQPEAGLSSPIPAVRRQAVVDCGRTKDPQALPFLIKALEDPEAQVRQEAARALGAMRDKRAAPALGKALADKSTTVRYFAAFALGEIKDPNSASALLAALRDAEWGVRDQAAWALREIGDATMIRPLTDLLKEKDADVPPIVWLLRGLEPAAVIEGVGALVRERDANIRLRAIQVLAALRHREATTFLLAALKDEDVRIRQTAVKSLIDADDDRAESALRDLAARETDPAAKSLLDSLLARVSGAGSLGAYWSFDDQNTKTARDQSGNRVDGAIKGCVVAPGKSGQALKFGKDSVISFGKPASLRLANAPHTIMAWIKPEAPTGVVVARGGAFCGYSLYLKDGLPKFGIRRVQDGPLHVATGQQAVALNEWTHLAGVIGKEQVELYVNGRLAAASPTPGYLNSDCGQGMEIGFDQGNSPAEITDHFAGVIDEVKIFTAALDASAIAPHLDPLLK